MNGKVGVIVKSKFMTLKECAEYLGGNVPASTLRAEVLSGSIRAIRARPGCNSPILVSVDELDRWVREVAGKRQFALSPAQAAEGNKSGGRHDG